MDAAAAWVDTLPSPRLAVGVSDAPDPPIRGAARGMACWTKRGDAVRLTGRGSIGDVTWQV